NYNYIKYLEEGIKDNWNVLALADYKKTPISYGDLAESIYRLHSHFDACGLQKGDKVVLLGKNSLNWAKVFISVITYGAVIVPLLPDFKSEAVYSLVAHSDAKFLFTSGFIFNKLDTKELDGLDAVISIESFQVLEEFGDTQTSEAMKSSEEIFEKKYLPNLSSTKFKLGKIKADDLMILSYTSGTSGVPKGVMIPHRSIAANVWYGRKYMPLETGDPVLSFLPLAHMYGCAFEFLYPLTLGCFITLLGRVPSPNIIMQAFADIKPRLILTVPLVIEKVYKNKIKPQIETTKVKAALKVPILRTQVLKKINKSITESFGGNFKEIVIGGAPFNPEVEDFFKATKIRFSTGYGMTECGPLISYTGWKKRKMYSAGKRVDTLKVKVISRDQYNIPGEVLVKGDPVMLGYYKNEKLTSQVIDADGWLHTGDLGIVDKDGTISLKGRSKSMILGPSGQNIYPEEIEAVADTFKLVGQSLTVEREGKLHILVHPDEMAVKSLKLDAEKVKDTIEGYLDPINEKMPSYMHVSKIEVLEEPFELTPKNSIKRFLYTTENYQVHRVKD
ncbi:MAG: long-chain fatty acid--CoA ligase, partial [Bacteroidetes bacterium 4572_77]